MTKLDGIKAYARNNLRSLVIDTLGRGTIS